MIVQLRVDERLIHGQIITAWCRALDIDTIFAANDKVASNEIGRRAMLMTAPAGKKVALRSVDDAIRLLSDERAKKLKVMLIVFSPQDALKLVKALDIKEVNIANSGRSAHKKKYKFNDYFKAEEEDMPVLKELNELTHVFCQMLPSTEYKEFNELLATTKPSE